MTASMWHRLLRHRDDRCQGNDQRYNRWLLGKAAHLTSYDNHRSIWEITFAYHKQHNKCFFRRLDYPTHCVCHLRPFLCTSQESIPVIDHIRSPDITSKGFSGFLFVTHDRCDGVISFEIGDRDHISLDSQWWFLVTKCLIECLVVSRERSQCSDIIIRYQVGCETNIGISKFCLILNTLTWSSSCHASDSLFVVDETDILILFTKNQVREIYSIIW